jgi:hypothetical protein
VGRAGSTAADGVGRRRCRAYESLPGNFAGRTVRRVATGWAEFWSWIRRRAGADNRDLEATWTRFQKLAESSERADLLKHIVHVGRILPDQERYRLAVATTRMLAPIEWPKEWSEARPALVTALDTLVIETDPGADVSFFALHDMQDDADPPKVGHIVLVCARDLLLRPCRRDDLPTVARLCNTGSAACLRAYRKAYRMPYRQCTGAPPVDEDSRARFRSAFAAYAEAAETFNGVVGVVLFEGLDAPVP